MIEKDSAFLYIRHCVDVRDIHRQHTLTSSLLIECDPKSGKNQLKLKEKILMRKREISTWIELIFD